MCWEILDKKAKKVNFVFQKVPKTSQEKAQVETIEMVGEQIEAL